MANVPAKVTFEGVDITQFIDMGELTKAIERLEAGEPPAYWSVSITDPQTARAIGEAITAPAASAPMIYVVTTGTYSDYRIVGVYTTREKAEAVIALQERRESGYDAQIEEYELDQWADGAAAGYTSYEVNFNPMGEVHSVDADPFDWFGPIRASKTGAHPWPGTCDLWITVWVVARDEGHAIKIAADKRGQYLAEQAGIA